MSCDPLQPIKNTLLTLDNCQPWCPAWKGQGNLPNCRLCLWSEQRGVWNQNQSFFFSSDFRILKMETHSAFLIRPALAVVGTHRENFPLSMFLRSWGLCPSSLYCICPCPLSLLFVIIFPLFPILFRTLIIASLTPTGNSGTTRKFEMC